MNAHSFKEVIPMGNKYMKRCSTSLVIRAIKIKTMMRYHFTHTKMAVIKKMVT